jgi:hypothetical protein
MQLKGNLIVKGTAAARRVNLQSERQALSSSKSLLPNDPSWIILSCDLTQQVVLPDATTLPVAWEINIYTDEASVANIEVATYDATTPSVIESVYPGVGVKLVLVDNSTSEGTWLTSSLTSNHGPMLVEYHTLTEDDVTLKRFILPHKPWDSSQIMVDVITGISQCPGIDFVCTGQTVSWNGLGMEQVVSIGTIVRFAYHSLG